MRLILLLALLTSIFIGACQNNDTEQNNHASPYMKLSTLEQYDQGISNHIKVRLNKREQLSKIHAVNDEKNILIAFDVDHHHRFTLGKIEQEIQKEIEKLFPEHEVTVSTDLKILLSLEELEKEIHEGTISQERISKELNLLVKLTKDEA